MKERRKKLVAAAWGVGRLEGGSGWVACLSEIAHHLARRPYKGCAGSRACQMRQVGRTVRSVGVLSVQAYWNSSTMSPQTNPFVSVPGSR